MLLLLLKGSSMKEYSASVCVGGPSNAMTAKTLQGGKSVTAPKWRKARKKSKKMPVDRRDNARSRVKRRRHAVMQAEDTTGALPFKRMLPSSQHGHSLERRAFFGQFWDSLANAGQFHRLSS
jgi:hypothetical protein